MTATAPNMARDQQQQHESRLRVKNMNTLATWGGQGLLCCRKNKEIDYQIPLIGCKWLYIW